MPKIDKSTVWIVLLVLVGGVVLFLSYQSHKPQAVVLNDIAPQKPADALATTAVDTNAVKKVDPVPPMAIVTSPVDGKEAGFTIQVYSFQDKNRAENALQVLQGKGYPAFLIVSDLGAKGVWYRIRVGGILDAAAAHKMLDEIRKNYNSGFILKPTT